MLDLELELELVSWSWSFFNPVDVVMVVID